MMRKLAPAMHLAAERPARTAVRLRDATPPPSLVEAVRAGLSQRQKTLPAALLYDDVGSALFEAITFLPEYEVTRADFEAHLTRVLGESDIADWTYDPCLWRQLDALRSVDPQRNLRDPREGA